jgi:hypothetical protein
MSAAGESSLPSPPNAAQAGSKLRWKVVLLVIVPVIIVALAVVAFSAFGDLDRLLSDLSRPAMVPAGGQVLFNGQPLPNAQVMTAPTRGGGLPALGWTDDEGRFTLKTDIRGSYIEGATVGEHGVAVSAYEVTTGAGASAPPLLTPTQYAAVGTSPLRITIGRNPDENQFKFDLQGEPPTRPQRPTKGKGKGSDEDKADADPGEP